MKLTSEIKIFAVILVVAVALVAFTVLPTLRSNNPTPIKHIEDTPLKKSDLIQADTHIKGNKDAPFTLVVFSDFQCPMCKDVSPQLNKIVENSKGQLNMAYHHFKPRPDHIHSQQLSRASEAAAVQGKFWEMHDELFKIQDLVKEEPDDKVDILISQLAKDIKLDLLKFQATLKSKNIDDPFLADNVLAIQQLKLGQTPSFFGIEKSGKIQAINNLADIRTWVKREGIPE